MGYIDILKAEIQASGEDPAFAGGASDATIAEFESILGVEFPPSYKDFLRIYGALSFGGDTYYGITKSGKDATSVPSVLFATKSARDLGDIDPHMVMIKSSGYGPIYSIDTSCQGVNGEAAVVKTQLSFKRDGVKKVIFDSFEEFILHEVRQAIKDL